MRAMQRPKRRVVSVISGVALPPEGLDLEALLEVMAIDRSFEAALQKAVRSLEAGGASSLAWESPDWDGPGGEERLMDGIESGVGHFTHASPGLSLHGYGIAGALIAIR